MTKSIPSLISRRRLFATAAAATVVATGMPYVARAQTARYRRWEITDPNMPPRILDSYKMGIREMLRRPATDPRNWYRNAFIHLFDCPHRNWWFLAWHRGYIGWLEQTIRVFSGDRDFALPYWDWTKNPRVPAAMFDDVLDPNNPGYIPTLDQFQATFSDAVSALWPTFSPAQLGVLGERGFSSPSDFMMSAGGMFFEQPNARGLTAANPDLDPATQVAVSTDTINSALQVPVFAGSADGMDDAGFVSSKADDHNGSAREGILESQPHDNVHGAMGGPSGNAFMVSFLSSVDPIFFLHHANLDRLWDVWTRRQAALGRPTLPQGDDLTTWSREQFLFFSAADGSPVAKTNASDYASITSFDYDYSPGSGEDQVPPAVAVAAVVAPARRFSAQLTSAVGGVAGVPAAALGPRVSLSRPHTAEITLDLMPSDLRRRFRVLVSSPGGGTVDAGAITVFAHAHGPTTFTVPLPASVAGGAAAAGNVPIDIRVAPLEPQTTAEAARLGAAPPPRVLAITVRTN